jgi:hypothetical protein
MLERGDLIPHFQVTNLQGEPVAYSNIWQQRNVVLIMLPATDWDGTFRDYVSQITAQVPPSTHDDTAWVVTRDPVAGLSSPGVVVADRWGEIVHIAGGSQAGDLPVARELVEWLEYVRHRCPECEGEAK